MLKQTKDLFEMDWLVVEFIRTTNLESTRSYQNKISFKTGVLGRPGGSVGGAGDS